MRQLDTAQLRLQAALQRVENVLNLKNTIDKVEKSVEARDYITAATNTHRVIYLMKPVKNELSYQVLVGLESQVRNLVSEECQNAISRRDWQKAMSMSQLFPYLSLPYRGLAFHCLAARSQLADLLHNKGRYLIYVVLLIPFISSTPRCSHFADTMATVLTATTVDLNTQA